MLVTSTAAVKTISADPQGRRSGYYTSDSLRSLAFKDAVPFPRFSIISPENSYSKLGDAIALINRANSGNALAQHDLGILYLTGQNFPADTFKAAYWIRKAADNHFLPARFNLGILQHNGWGVPWNPFEAYKSYKGEMFYTNIRANKFR
jgi:TPR repeat protein